MRPQVRWLTPPASIYRPLGYSFKTLLSPEGCKSQPAALADGMLLSVVCGFANLALSGL